MVWYYKREVYYGIVGHGELIDRYPGDFTCGLAVRCVRVWEREGGCCCLYWIGIVFFSFFQMIVVFL